MFTISKTFTFSASHQLDGLPDNHPCSRLHGHNYSMTLTLRDDNLNEVGFVKDYRELDEIKQYIDNQFDHRHLNDILTFNPTAENMARYFYEQVKQTVGQLTSITIRETDKTSATYEP